MPQRPLKQSERRVGKTSFCCASAFQFELLIMRWNEKNADAHGRIDRGMSQRSWRPLTHPTWLILRLQSNDLKLFTDDVLWRVFSNR